MPHNFVGISRKLDNFRRGTILDPLDEPTYLSFAIDFNFEAQNSITGSKRIDESRLWESPLFNLDTSNDNSAAAFLQRRGYPDQAEGLAAFQGMLGFLTNNAPWYFQSIRGVDKLFEANTDVKKEWKTKNIRIDIETLEAVDLRMSELAGLYRNAIYDLKYRRERVPDNLRWFSMDIYLAEFRKLRYTIPPIVSAPLGALGISTAPVSNLIGEANNALGALGFNGLEENLTGVMAQFGYLKFRCRQCEFDFSKSIPTQGKVNVGGTDFKAETNQFSIKIGHFEEESKYGTGTLLHEDTTKFGTKVKNPWQTRVIGDQIQSALRYADNLTGNQASDRIRNSVQDFTARNNAVSGFINGIGQSATNFLGQNNITQDRLGNAYPNGKPNKESVNELGDVYTGNNGNPPVGNLGDVYPNPPSNPPINDLGDIYPDPDLPSNPIDDLGDVYP